MSAGFAADLSDAQMLRCMHSRFPPHHCFI